MEGNYLCHLRGDLHRNDAVMSVTLVMPVILVTLVMPVLPVMPVLVGASVRIYLFMVVEHIRPPVNRATGRAVIY